MTAATTTPLTTGQTWALVIGLAVALAVGLWLRRRDDREGDQ